jgi:NAD(P)-dependent dehydrogenase (short-subunit alcohol dehydrogenase family)
LATDISLTGRVAIVTGAGRGIGRSVALDLAARGAHVVVNDLGVEVDGSGSDTSVAGGVVAEIRSRGGVAAASTASVATDAGARDIVSTAVREFGQVDVLVNNAGIIRNRISHRLSDDDWDSVIQTHLYGTFYCTRAALAVMREREYGRIVNMTSASALIGAVGQANYMAAKMGIVGLTRGTAFDQQAKGIKANCLSPSAVTRMIGALPDGARPDLKDDDSGQTCLTDVVAWMCSDAFPVTGQVLGVRGSRVMLYGQHRPVYSFQHVPAGGTMAEVSALVERLATPMLQVTEFFGD